MDVFDRLPDEKSLYVIQEEKESQIQNSTQNQTSLFY